MGSEGKPLDIYFGVLVVPNPNKDGAVNDLDVATVPESMSFRLSDSNAMTFYLASKDSGSHFSALLYVPTIDDTEDCGYDSLPSNVTHVSQLPSRYNNVALAPLTSPSCARIWMDRAHFDGAQDIIFYGPNDGGGSGGLNDNSSAIPSADWIGSTNGLTYSIYYIPGSLGEELVNYLSLYSGNMTGVPYGSELVQYFDFRDYVRVAVEINNPNSNNIPGLWVFLVIALAVLLLTGITSSFIVHLLQYRNRRQLRQRIANGEIDLEALGIKRLTVPRWILDKLPVRVYVPGDPRYVRHSSDEATKPEVDNIQLQHPFPATTTAVTAKSLGPDGPPTPSSTPLSVSEFSQTTCPICLEDFIPNVTLVRELPCLHIYHLECIDAFLEHQSSLCPLCKQSALPRGYIPSTLRITNATVRRERRLRRDNALGDEDDRSTFGRFSRLWRGRSNRDYNDQLDEYELQDMPIVRQQVALTPSDNNSPSATAGPEQPDVDMADITAERHTRPQSGRQARRENETQSVIAADGAIVADDGTVFMMENQHEESRMRRAVHILFPYFA
ncbi:uncharacterized protein V1513DRAFT_382328 [Lipomyces chichibuensis]|uniref:uncharacterized protein n=1 Tax=Lipomyces chichibuensis TaxID=1546026 RepID=UPI003343284C